MLLALLPLFAHADEPPRLDDPRLGLPQIHGFVSQGFLLSSGNNYLAHSLRGSFEFTEAALNATAAPTDTLTLSMQLFTRDLGTVGDYKASFDWFFLDWHRVDEIGLRAGRVRMPFGLFNTTIDYDPARVSVLLPSALYPTTSRDYLLAVTGGELYGVLDLGAVGHLDYSGYGGAIHLDVDAPGFLLEIPYTVGGQLLWETPVPGLSAAGSVLATKFQGTLATPKVLVEYEIPASLAVGSLQYLRGRVLVAAEYVRQHTRLESSDDTLYPDEDLTGDGYYLLATVETRPWLHLGGYYSVSNRDVEHRDDLTQVQHDAALTVRFDLNQYWLLKLEGHYLHGVGATTDALNPDTPITDRPVDWALGIVKTTAYF
jgi:hypothetical protein